MSLPLLSVIIPIYNESARIGQTIQTLRHRLDPCRPFELLIVDDGSTDDTAAIVTEQAAQDARVHLLRQTTNRGKGSAVRAGMLAASGPWRLFVDADLPVPVPQLEALAKRLEGADVVIASRDARQLAHRSLPRRAASAGFNRLVRAAFDLRMADTQCGIKAFRRHAAHAIFSRCRVESFAFDVEVLLLARRLGCSLTEYPVRIGQSGLSTVNLAAHAWPVLRDVARLRRALRAPLLPIFSSGPATEPAFEEATAGAPSP